MGGIALYLQLIACDRKITRANEQNYLDAAYPLTFATNSFLNTA